LMSHLAKELYSEAKEIFSGRSPHHVIKQNAEVSTSRATGKSASSNAGT
jgi:hypothetical protein